MKTIAVIPAYNESQTIRGVVRELKGKVDEIIVVDDGSEDNTSELSQREGAQALKHFFNRGQGAALQTGIEFALKRGAEIVVTFDADGQHDAHDIPRLLEPILGGEAEVVLGSRFLKSQNTDLKSQNLGISILKYSILKLAVIFTKITTGLNVTDTHNGLRAFKRSAAEKILIRQDGMAHATEILEEIVKHNLRYVEVPVHISYTEYSKRKGQKITGGLKILWDLFIGRMSR